MTDVKLPEPFGYLTPEGGFSYEKNSTTFQWFLRGVRSGALFWPSDATLLFTADQLTAAVMADRAERWRPIETAPRDELILVGPTKRMGICAAMNHSRDGWVTETCGEWASIYTPTHWQPLPQPPAEDGE